MSESESKTMDTTTAKTPSFVGEMLATVGKLEKEDLAQRIGQLSEKIDSIKIDVYENLSAYYKDFYPDMSGTQDLSGRVNSLSSEMKTLTEKIEKEIHGKLLTKSSEYTDFSEKMNEMDSVMKILDTLVDCHETLETAKRNLASASYIECAENLYKLKKLVEGSADKNIKVLASLYEEVTVQNTNLVYQLGEKWREIVTLDAPTDFNADTRINDDVTLTINKANTKNLLKAMHKMDILHHKVRHLASVLLEYILTDLIKGSGTISIKQKSTTGVLTLEKRQTIITPQETFDKVGQILDFLYRDFLDVVLDGSNAMQILGGHLGKPLTELIIRECLAVAVPTKQKDLQQFATTVRATEKFQKFLDKHGVVDSEASETLVSYISNVNTLFANKLSQTTLVKARQLMLAEIHNMVKVGINPGKKEETKGLTVNMMEFAECCISNSVEELMQMAYDMMVEASNSKENYGLQLYFCVRNMFELYAVVPTYHERSLEELPQVTALYYNNCMYITHHLATLGHQFGKGRDDKQFITFLDLIPMIREQGIECFLAQMRRQRDQIFESLSLADNFISIADLDHNNSAEKAINQVFYQLKRLQNLWQEVLPQSVYWKSMGTLVNSTIDEIMRQVMVLEDISAEDAGQLHGLTTRITEQIPNLFNKEKKDLSIVARYVPQWVKFTEFQLLLNTTLAMIGHRWADGKGPLAAHFKATEIKQMIRAMYQNTEVRANVLAKF